MTSSDGPATHLLSLKVMRVSRPTLASSWQPFYSSSPSFSAHSTESILSLQGVNPLPGHPKTLRDLTQATELLTLPASFGSIQLGETFSSCLAVNNEATTEIGSVALKVEMQTSTSKIVLADIGGPDSRLSPGDTLENIVHHEIKELGQHVLACTVSYRFPQKVSRAAPASEHSADPDVTNFKKYYKFAVTNPLSVKTKVHAPRSPSAMMIPTERDKVFLEVHIQNLTPEPIWFERMRFEPVDGWNARDVNVIDVDKKGEEQSLYTDSTALMQPQDMRQYIYILTPKTSFPEPIVHTPGSVIPLGRLDISWRSSYGEPGRLLTSMLTRRIPLPPPVQPPQAQAQPASALPPYLKRTSASASASASATPPSRPRSPQLSQSQVGSGSRPGSPTPRPASPYRPRASSIVQGLPTTTTPVIPFSPPPPSLPLSLPLSNTVPVHSPIAIDATLILNSDPSLSISVGTHFTLSFRLVLSSVLPSEKQGQRLRLSLVVQHLTFPPPPSLPVSTASGGKLVPGAGVGADSSVSGYSVLSSSSPGFSTPSPTTYTTSSFNYPLAHQKLQLLHAAASEPRDSAGESRDDVGEDTNAQHDDSGQDPINMSLSRLPPPFFDFPAQDESNLKRQRASMSKVTFYGPSAIVLPTVELVGPSESSLSSSVESHTTSTSSPSPSSKHQGTLDFDVEYIPLQRGLAAIGGLRLLIVGEKYVGGSGEQNVEAGDGDGAGNEAAPKMNFNNEVRTLKEWSVVNEAWVS